MKHIFFIGVAVALIFLVIAINLGDYNNRNQNLQEKQVSQSIAEAESMLEAMNTEPNMWDKVNNAQEKLQTTVPKQEESEMYSMVTDKDGNVEGYQKVKNVVYDDNGNVVSYDTEGKIISPEEYSAIQSGEVTTKRKHTKEEQITIVVE